MCCYSGMSSVEIFAALLFWDATLTQDLLGKVQANVKSTEEQPQVYIANRVPDQTVDNIDIHNNLCPDTAAPVPSPHHHPCQCRQRPPAFPACSTHPRASGMTVQSISVTCKQQIVQTYRSYITPPLPFSSVSPSTFSQSYT